MKRIFLVFVLLSNLANAQEIQENRMEISFSYGLSFRTGSKQENLSSVPDLYTPRIGTFANTNIDFKIPKNRFIGIGFARQTHSQNLDDEFLTLDRVNIDGITVTNSIKLENYRSTYQLNYFDIHFRTVFKDKINLTLGFFYYLLYNNNFVIDGEEDENQRITQYTFKNDAQRADNFGLFLSLDYFIPVKDYLSFGLRGNLYYSLSGIEGIMLSPVVKIKI